MAFELKMPKLGESVTEGTIGKWLKQPGDAVKKYDLLVEVQTDKVNTEIPSEVDGTLSEIKVQEGETVSVGTILAVFETAGGAAQAQPAEAKPEAKAAAKPAEAAAAPAAEGKATASPAAAEAPAPPATDEPAAAQTAPAEAVPSDGHTGNGKVAAAGADVRATPAVRKLAAEHAVDLSQVQGTGLGGRVSRQDIESFIAAKGSPASPAAAGEAGEPFAAMNDSMS